MVFNCSNIISWLKQLMPRLIAGMPIALALGIIGFAVFGGLSEQSEYERRFYQSSQRYTADTYSPAYYSCLRLAGQSMTNCVAKANEEWRENERKEQDLVAQQTTAIWTFLMGVAAIVGVTLSALGVYLVWTTFNETRKANEISKSQARASITISDASLRIPKNGFQPTPKGHPIFPEGSYMFVLGCQIENTGLTVAKDVKLFARLTISEHVTRTNRSEPAYGTEMLEAAKIGDVLNRAKEEKTGVIASITNTVDGQRAPSINGTFNVNLRVEFGDTFGDKWFLETEFHGLPSEIVNERMPLSILGRQWHGKID